MPPKIVGEQIAQETNGEPHGMRRFSASLIREVSNGAMGRPGLLPFWFGESNRPTPLFIREAAISSLQAGETFYTENLGRPFLRHAIAHYLTTLHNRPISMDRVAVTPSGNTALMIANQLLLQPGKRAVLVTPLWPNVVEMPKILSARVVCVSLEVRGGRWSLPVERLIHAITPETGLLVLNSPGNPTGWTIDAEEQRVIFDHCRKQGTWILADDVYERLVYRDELRSAPSFLRLAEEDDRVISVNSFSKAWCMTGFRVGWMVAPARAIQQIGPLIEYNSSCVAEFVQRAATVALEQGEEFVDSMRAELKSTKSKLLNALRRIPGVDLPEADGAMYAFFRLSGYHDSVLLAKQLIEEVGLGLAPGRAFGPEGEGWLRWCYAAEWTKVQAGIERLERFLHKHMPADADEAAEANRAAGSSCAIP